MTRLRSTPTERWPRTAMHEPMTMAHQQRRQQSRQRPQREQRRQCCRRQRRRRWQLHRRRRQSRVASELAVQSTPRVMVQHKLSAMPRPMAQPMSHEPRATLRRKLTAQLRPESAAADGGGADGGGHEGGRSGGEGEGGGGEGEGGYGEGGADRGRDGNGYGTWYVTTIGFTTCSQLLRATWSPQTCAC